MMTKETTKSKVTASVIASVLSAIILGVLVYFFLLAKEYVKKPIKNEQKIDSILINQKVLNVQYQDDILNNKTAILSVNETLKDGFKEIEQNLLNEIKSNKEWTVNQIIELYSRKISENLTTLVDSTTVDNIKFK